MTGLITILLVGIALALLIPCTVLLVECLAACVPASSLGEAHKKPPRIAVLMPAHNEAVIIEKTLNTILAQLRDSDRLIVIADNCKDQTADLARQAGATVIERHNLTQLGKGYAIDFGLHFLEPDPPDIVILIDADSLVEPGAIHYLSQQAYTSGKPVQSVYIMEYPQNPTAKDTLSALAFLVKNQVRATGLSRLGLPCLLAGTGMAFPWSVLQKTSLATGNIVEDMQLGIDLAIVGYPPLFCPQAKVIGILPQQEQAAKKQRTRWEHGHLQTLLTQVPRLLKAAMIEKRFDLLSLALELGVPPLSLLVMLWGTAFIISSVTGILSGIWFPVFLILVAGLFLFIAILIAWYTFARPMISGKALLSIPLYLAWKIPLYFTFLIRPEQKWVKTERDTTT